MTPEKENQIFQEFGKWFDRENRHRSCMCFGFTHSDGWFDIEWKLCIKIRQLLSQYGIPEEAYEVAQVKEKFGGLRWYHHMRNPDNPTDYMPENTQPIYQKCFDAINQVVEEACVEASRTCEWCSQPGELREGSWLRTLCDECYAKSLHGYRPWRDQ